jgi:beclin 1
LACNQLTRLFRIDAANGKIGPPSTEGLSVKYAFSSEELWTRALKYMLANLKWILVWIADNSTQ